MHRFWGDAMKHFLADGMLIFILVGIGSTLMKQQGEEQITMQYRIEEFEKSVDEQQIIEPQVEGASLNKIEMNKAAKLAEGTSEVIVQVVDTTVSMITSLFISVIE